MNKNLRYPIISKYSHTGNVTEASITFSLQYTPCVSNKDLCPFVKSHFFTLVGKEREGEKRILSDFFQQTLALISDSGNYYCQKYCGNRGSRSYSLPSIPIQSQLSCILKLNPSKTEVLYTGWRGMGSGLGSPFWMAHCLCWCNG